MSLQFSRNPSEDDIIMAHSAERALLNYNSNVGNMSDQDLSEFFRRMSESAEILDLETPISRLTIPVTYNLFWEIWHYYTHDNTRVTPYEFQKRHRKHLIFSGASQAVMLMFGMMPSQVDLKRWNSHERTYLSENLQTIARAVGHDGQLLCPRSSFFTEWRRLTKLVDFIDIVQAMPTTDYRLNHGDLREYIRRLPEEKWLAARKALPSDLF